MFADVIILSIFVCEYLFPMLTVIAYDLVESYLEVTFQVVPLKSLRSYASAVITFDSMWYSTNTILLLFVTLYFWSWSCTVLFILHIYICLLLWLIIRVNMHFCWLFLCLLLALKWHLKTITPAVYLLLNFYHRILPCRTHILRTFFLETCCNSNILSCCFILAYGINLFDQCQHFLTTLFSSRKYFIN